MSVEVQCTKRFKETLEGLSLTKRRTVLKKVRLLIENPSSSALNAHRYTGEENAWECYIDRRMRLIYEKKGRIVCLKDLGYHAIVDKPFHHSASSYLYQLELDEADDQTCEDEVEAQIEASASHWDEIVLPPLENSEVFRQGTSNYLQFFQNTHLRVLGVPAHLVQSLKEAESLEDALALPDLPERTRNWLMELSTSPTLKEVRFDSSRLLFRTTLDRLEGYCEGRIKQLMLNLQPEQQQYVELERTPLILLKGVAGSGKTTIGIYRSIRLAEQGRSVLFVTFTKTLSTVTASLMEELVGPLPDNLTVRTVHSVMRAQLGKRCYLPKIGDPLLAKFLRDALDEVRSTDRTSVLRRDVSFFDDEIKRVIKGLGLKSVEEYKEVERYGRKTALAAKQREAVWRVYKAYQRRLAQAHGHDWADLPLLLLQMEESLFQQYDDIILDEAQDLTPMELRALQRFLVAPSPNPSLPSSLMVLGDAAQTLYSRGFSWRQAGIQARGHTAILRKNHRNTRQIAEAAAQLLKQNTFMRASNEYVDPEWTQRQGPSPILLGTSGRPNQAANHFHQIEIVKNHVLDLVSDQTFRLSDIAIICRSNEFCQRCQIVLKQHGLRAVLRSDHDFNLLEEQIKILTIHSAKGLEFPVVFLLGLIEGELPLTCHLGKMEEEEKQLEIERERILCYVGMTRAADALYLLTVQGKESRFIQELSRKITVCE